jgi:PAS domain S-box-containing protein
MRTRVDGNESAGTERSPFEAGHCHKPADTAAHMGTELLARAPVRQEFSSGIAEYCNHFQALADPAPQMIWRFGPDGQCKYFNQSWLDYRGRTPEQERGSGWMEGMHPEDLNRWATAYRSAFETRQPFHLEFRIKRADASYGSVFAHAVPQYLLDGSFVGYVGSLEETSHEDSGSVQHEHRGVEAFESARQALCQIAASLRQALSPVSERRRPKRRKQRKTLPEKVLLECLDISVTPLLVVDKGGRAVYCNSAFQAFASKRLPTTTWAASNVNPWPSLAGQLSSTRARPTQAVNCTAEVQAWLDSDSIALDQDIRVCARPLTIAGNELTMFSIIDISQENRTRLLERAFLHDLVNAAGSIQMLIDLLTGGTSRQERAEYIQLLQVSITRLLSEIYHEKMMLDSTSSMPFKVHEILTSLAEYYRDHHFGRNCRIEINESTVESTALLGDQTLLVRVLDNMLRNAIEATSHAGGTVTLGCRETGGELEFWVHNPNTISENVRAKIFHPSTSIDGRARDVGNQETKLLSELCGGTVTVSSDHEFGTTYSVRYPAAVETVSPRKRYHTKHAS